MALEDFALRLVRMDFDAAPYGERNRILRKWAELLDCSTKTLRRGVCPQRTCGKGKRRIEKIEEYVQIVFEIKKMPPEQVGEVITEQAIEIAIQNGLIPPSMKNRASTFDRVAREMGLTKKTRRVQRFQADYPNELHHTDASTSKVFYIARELPDGDYVLKLHAGSKSGYKNKPVPIRLRPWAYGLVDDHSGFYVGRYVAAYGETALDNLSFLSWAWAQNEDKPFFGLPEKLKGDLGPMMRGDEAKDFFNRLGVKIDPSEPGNKEAHGKIERPWRTAWQRFETPYFVQPDWKKFEITLSELNRQFMIYQQKYNEMAHRYEKDITRYQAWKRINLRGGAVAMPEKALCTVAKRIERKVGVDGCITVDNKIYEVKGLHDAWVYVYLGVFNDKIVVEDKKTGSKYEVEDFTPNPVNVFTAHKETPHQKAVKNACTLEAKNALYDTEDNPGNVSHFPTRVKEVRTIENPLAVDAYTNVDEALSDFIGLIGFVPEEEDREAAKSLFLENGLSRRFVTDLALDFQVLNERNAYHG